MAVKAAMVRAQETAAVRVRLFNDLSAKPGIGNPMTAGSPLRGVRWGASAGRR